MKTVILEKADNIHKLLKKYRRSSVYKFRGQSDSDWKLIPKSGREQFSKVDDASIFRNWKRRAVMHIQNYNLNDWEYLAIAQHTGLPTRLLDWSHIPLIAAFFACNEHPEKDGAIFAIKPYKLATYDEAGAFEIEVETIKFVQPSSPSQRLANQFGYFTVHNPPSLELNEENDDLLREIEKIIIPKEIKPELIFLLNHYGVNYLTIYPDLEGLSKHLAWFIEYNNYWDGVIEEE